MGAFSIEKSSQILKQGQAYTFLQSEDFCHLGRIGTTVWLGTVVLKALKSIKFGKRCTIFAVLCLFYPKPVINLQILCSKSLTQLSQFAPCVRARWRYTYCYSIIQHFLYFLFCAVTSGTPFQARFQILQLTINQHVVFIDTKYPPNAAGFVIITLLFYMCDLWPSCLRVYNSDWLHNAYLAVQLNFQPNVHKCWYTFQPFVNTIFVNTIFGIFTKKHFQL